MNSLPSASSKHGNECVFCIPQLTPVASIVAVADDFLWTWFSVLATPDRH
jgi:hypothetical protein